MSARRACDHWRHGHTLLLLWNGDVHEAVRDVFTTATEGFALSTLILQTLAASGDPGPTWSTVLAILSGIVAVLTVVTPVAWFLFGRFLKKYDVVVEKALAAVPHEKLLQTEGTLKQLVKDAVAEVKQETATNTKASIEGIAGMVAGVTYRVEKLQKTVDTHALDTQVGAVQATRERAELLRTVHLQGDILIDVKKGLKITQDQLKTHISTAGLHKSGK